MRPRHERDVINVAQVERFAQTFGLPLFKWKLPLVDHIHDEKLLRDLYLDEPMLWGYFAEGVPRVRRATSRRRRLARERRQRRPWGRKSLRNGTVSHCTRPKRATWMG